MFYKTILIPLVIISLLCTSSMLAQDKFEGKVTMRISSEQATGKPTDMDYFVKGNKFRIEMKSDEGMAVILHDQKDKKTYMIMPEQKMYMDLDASSYVDQSNKSNDNKAPDIKRTGEFKEINGYKCEKWLIKEDNENIEAWMTDELGGFYMMNDPMTGSSQNQWMQQLIGNYMPMKVVDIDEDGKKTTMEVVSVNKMSLTNELFSIPPGFQKFQMPNINIDKQK